MPKTRRGRATRARLLDAAIEEFGARGFHAAAISGITAGAGVALGTFYVHFASKEAIYRAVVAYLGERLRGYLRAAVTDQATRLEAERAGLAAFLAYVREHPALYRIVMEAQFVDEPAFRAYFAAFADAYAGKLDTAAGRGEVRPGDAEARAWALIGMGVFLGLRYARWDDGDPLDAAMDLIGHGLAPA